MSSLPLAPGGVAPASTPPFSISTHLNTEYKITDAQAEWIKTQVLHMKSSSFIKAAKTEYVPWIVHQEQIPAPVIPLLQAFVSTLEYIGMRVEYTCTCDEILKEYRLSYCVFCCCPRLYQDPKSILHTFRLSKVREGAHPVSEGFYSPSSPDEWKALFERMQDQMTTSIQSFNQTHK